MRNVRVGILTSAIALIILGLMIILHTLGHVSYETLRYLWPLLIILFGLEVLYYRFRFQDKRPQYSRGSIGFIVAVGVISGGLAMIHPSLRALVNGNWNALHGDTSAGHIDFGGFGPSYEVPVKGDVAVNGKIQRVVIQVVNARVTVTGTEKQTVSYDGDFPVDAASQKEANTEIHKLWTVSEQGDTLRLVYQPSRNSGPHFDIGANDPYLNVSLPKSLISDVTTQNGAVQVSDVNASSSVRTRNGSISISHVKGNASAMTNNGAIKLNDIHHQVQAQTTNGTISGQSSVGGAWQCDTTNGAIALSIPSTASVSLSATTVNGHIGGIPNWTFSDKHHGSASLHGGTYQMLLKTVNGSVTINGQ